MECSCLQIDLSFELGEWGNVIDASERFRGVAPEPPPSSRLSPPLPIEGSGNCPVSQRNSSQIMRPLAGTKPKQLYMPREVGDSGRCSKAELARIRNAKNRHCPGDKYSAFKFSSCTKPNTTCAELANAINERNLCAALRAVQVARCFPKGTAQHDGQQEAVDAVRKGADWCADRARKMGCFTSHPTFANYVI